MVVREVRDMSRSSMMGVDVAEVEARDPECQACLTMEDEEAEPAAAEPVDQEVAAEEPADAAEDEVEAGAAPSDLTDTDEIVAFCRQVDG